MASSRDRIEEITASSDSTEAPPSNLQQSLPKSMPSTSNAAPPSNLQQSPSKSLPSTSNEAAPPSNLQLSLSKSMPSTSTAAPPSLPSTDVIPNKSKFSIRKLRAIFKAAKFFVSKPQPPENIIPDDASRSTITNKDDQPEEVLPVTDDDLRRLNSAWEKYTNHMNVQINLARDRFKELQKPGGSERDRVELRKAVEKLNLQIPSSENILSTTNIVDCQGGYPSPSSQMLCIDLDHVVSSFAEAKEYMDHMDEKIKQALEKFVELPKLGSSSQMANSDELRKANSYELRKALAKLKVQIPSHTKFRSADSNQPQMMCPNINAAREGAMHSNNKESKSADPGDSSDLLATFRGLPEHERHSLLCFFRFPPGATIKRTTMTHLWIAHGFYAKPQEQDCKSEENAANEVFDELIEKRFIELVNQKGSMAPDSCRMSRSVHSLLLEDAQKGGFTSNCSLGLDQVRDGTMQSNKKSPKSTYPGDYLLSTFRGLPEQERHSLLYFFRFPPETTIKRTMMTHLWLGQGFYARPWEQDCESEEKAANKVFDKLIEKCFIEPVHQKCSSVPEYFRMSPSVYSLLLKDAQKGGFTSNGSLGQNQVGDGRMNSKKKSMSAEPDDYSDLLATFAGLPGHVSNSLLCFFKFPPEATIKRTTMTHLWIGQGFCARPWEQYFRSEEDVANKVFDELIEKGFIKPVFQNCSLVPNSCRMSLDVHSLLLEHAERKGFTSNGSLGLDQVRDGTIHSKKKPSKSADPGDSSGLLATFHALPERERHSLLCFFRFPPGATIKRTTMTHLWIANGFKPREQDCESEQNAANKVFDELIKKRFIEPVNQRCCLGPDSFRMSLDVHSLLLEHAEREAFTSNGSLLDLGLVGEASINYEPKIFVDEGDIKSVYLGRWRSSATHHIELADDKILGSLCGVKKLNKLRFLSLRGISMITELPKNILKLQELRILDLRACHHLEAIPNKIGLLERLTHLDMSECYFLEHVPKSLAQLECLEVLKGFFIGDFNNKKQACTLSDLSKLSKLRKLNIYTSTEAFPRIWDLDALRKLDSLQKLTISWGGCSLQGGKIDKKNGEDKPTHEDIRSFANRAEGPLTLPSKLQKLDLQFFPNDTRPNWLTPVFLKELKKLYVQGGKLCDLGQGMQWTSVEILRLSYLSELKMDWEGLQKIFPKLIYLEQEDCPKLTCFQCKRGVWMNKKAPDTMQLQEYFKSTSGIKFNKVTTGCGPWDDYYEFPEDEKQREMEDKKKSKKKEPLYD